MNTKQRNKVLLVLTIALVISSCGPGQTPEPTLTLEPTSTPRPTSTATLIPTQTSTSTSTPTQTSTATLIPTRTPTPIPVSLVYNPVPRWMILAQPYYSVDILGEQWDYVTDRWGETYACIDYTKESGTRISFEQCFAQVDASLTFESVLAPFLDNDFEVLTPNTTFGEIGQISLLGKKLGGEPKTIEFFELIGTEKYLLLVEMYVETDDTAPLQTIYESQAADIINYVLQESLQKSRILPRPTATPLSPNQEGFYASFAEKLITEAEADALYGGTWELIGDHVFDNQRKVTRLFEDRTNADVLWVQFMNSIFLATETSFDNIASIYQQPGDVVLESSHEYEGKFALFGYNDGHTYFDAYLLHGPYIFFVQLESRTLVGETVEDVFSQEIDDFIYSVLMINVQR